MRVSFRKRLLVLLFVVLLLPVAAYWIADSWLESSGGRQMLERALSERIGMNVRLAGEFDLMLLPAIGVSGTGLVIGGPGPEFEFARSEEFEISVALRPLLERKVLVEWIRMTGGYIYPDRYSRTGGAAEVDSSAKLLLPEIRELSIRDFQIIWPGEEEARLKVSAVTISEFAENRETPFLLEIEHLVTAEGMLRWDASRSLIQFGNLQFDLAGQRVSGDGCLILQSPGALHLELQAGVFDLDAFQENLPAMGGGESEGGLPMEIRARFTAEELRTQGANARAAVLSLGKEPACEDFR
jgi:uncharacterized protein involved in outer membrane biogenesis